ncbi:MAG: nicotinate-nucleotide adenylyltransferase [Halanaerobiales bacterium]
MSQAILGGTFDPIHYGHLLIAEQAYNKFNLNDIIFMPAGFPPHKDYQHVSSPGDRLEMVKLAVKDNPHFSFSKFELKEDRVSYTVETLRYFQDKGYEQIRFIIGADSLLDMPNWREPEYLLTNACFIVAPRPTISIKEVLKKDFYREYLDHINVLQCPLIDISSSLIRREIKNNRSVKYMTPEPVINYIRENKLYQE